MNFKALVISVSLFCSMNLFANPPKVSNELHRYGGPHHPGHAAIHDHPYRARLTQGTLSSSQLVQLLVDRASVLGFLENLNLENGMLSNDGSLVSRREFFRSELYVKELESVGQSYTQAPSKAAEDYKAYLAQRSSEELVVHHWLFLFGETFGGQSFGKRFKTVLSNVGDTFSDFGGEDLVTVRRDYLNWLESKLDINQLPLYKEAIDRAYDFHNLMFSHELEASEEENRSSITGRVVRFVKSWLQW